MSYIGFFFGTFAYVMLRAFQQRNVAFDSYKWVVPTSYLMAVFDVYIVSAVAHAGWTWPVILANGSGGCLGALCAMWFHKRYVRK